MTNQITLEEALKLVSFYQQSDGTWHVKNVNGDVKDDVYGHVRGNVLGDVKGLIAGRNWQFVEMPKNRLRLWEIRC